MVDVSVEIITYYAEKYVAEAIESVLRQKTKYSYEIVISDDCSGDRTQEIILQYQEKYPDIIKVYTNDHNVGLTKNRYMAHCHCTGRYIAIVDGDDYFIDENKLEWQVEFLDHHPQHYGVACCVQGRYDESDEPFAVYPEKKYRDKSINLQQFLDGAVFGTNGLMFRNDYQTKEGRKHFSMMPKASPYIDDFTDCILLLQRGDIYISSRESTVYRVPRKTKGKHNFNSINSTRSKMIKELKMMRNLYNHMDPCPDLYHMFAVRLGIVIADSLRRLQPTDIRNFLRLVPEEYIRRGVIFQSLYEMIIVTADTIRRKLFA